MNINGEQPAQEENNPWESSTWKKQPEGGDSAPDALAWMKDLGAVIQGMSKAIGGATASLQSLVVFGKTVTDVTTYLKQLMPGLEIQQKIGKLWREMVPNLEKLAKLFQGLPNLLGPATDSFKGIGSITSSLLGPVSDFKDSLSSMAGLMIEFVGAINPGLVQLFQMAMRDITAVIGQAFGPALQEVIELIQEMAATFQPLFAALAPVLGELYDALTDFVSMQIQMFKPILELLVPILAVFGEVVRSVTMALMPVILVFKAMFAAIAPIVKMILEGLQMAIRFFTRSLLMLAALFMRMVGQKEMAKEMARGIDPNSEKERQRLQGFAAVSNINMTDVAGYSKQMLTSVAGAGLGTGGKKSSDEWLEQLSKDLDQIAEGNNESFITLKKEVLKAIADLGDKIVGALKGEVYKAANAAPGVVANTPAIGVALLSRLFGS